MTIAVRPLREDDVEAVVALALAAWAPVYDSIRATLGAGVYRRLYPDWRASHAAAVAAECRDPAAHVSVAVGGGPGAGGDTGPMGFVAVRFTTEDAATVGEIEMIAVDPGRAGTGVGDALMEHATASIAAVGVRLAVAATGGDPGHAPARRLYERHGFAPFPLVRYYREL